MNEVPELKGVKMLVGREESEGYIWGKLPSGAFVCSLQSNPSGVWSCRDVKPLPEPWEVAPEGYRLVTDEEMELDYPTDVRVMWMSNNGLMSKWEPSKEKSGWGCNNSMVFVVPLDFTFSQPEETVNIEGKEWSLSTIKQALTAHATFNGGAE